MSTQQNGAPKRPGPPANRFALTPNKFSNKPAAEKPSSSRASQSQPSVGRREKKQTGAHQPKPRPAQVQVPHPKSPTRGQTTPRSQKESASQPHPVGPQPVPAPSQPTPRVSNAVATPQCVPVSTSTPALASIPEQDAPRVKPARTLNSLAPDEFLDLAASSTPAQIASQYDVKPSTVYSQLSKMVRKRATDEGRSIANVKDDLNHRRVASGIIPANDGRYGIYDFQSRNRGSGPGSKALAEAVTAHDEGDSEQHVVSEMDLEDDSEHEADEDDLERPVGLGEDGNTSTLPAIEQHSDGYESVGIAIHKSEQSLPIAAESYPSIGAKGTQVEGVRKNGDQTSVDEGSYKDPEVQMTDDMQTSAPEETIDVKVESSVEDVSMHDLQRAAGDPVTSEAMMIDWQNSEVEMPTEVLHNNEALRLWTIGYRMEAVEMAQETKQYLKDFVLRPEDFD